MRVLFATTANLGHVRPMIPLARACAQAGVEVRVACPASFADRVTAAGYDAFGFDEPSADEIAGALAGLGPNPSRQESNLVMIRDVFGRLRGRAALPRMQQVVDEWRPDLIVREPAEVASLVVAESRGIPHVQSAIGILETLRLLMGMIGHSFADFEGSAGLEPGSLLAAASEAPLYTIVPPGFDDDVPGPGEPRAIHRFRYNPAPEGPETDLPRWGDADAPLVYVTFGTVTATSPAAGAYRDVIDALSRVYARVLVAIGPDGDPDSVRPWPRNAHVERVPPPEVMRSAQAVVTHGGFGTTMTALASGAPQVVIPQFANDQWINAMRVQATGVGKALIAEPPPWELLARTVTEVVEDRSSADTAAELQQEQCTLPPPEAMVMRMRDDALALR
ncbi:glycosyltransferase [Microbacterium thalassium]|uniref:UDP:flavonoid glycosyltransferase YjiC (YdhE family) n=1 Tax=Microbacterium thalassium TaxID=362649 RepID=A0A7X0KW41_9MICO|nr:glycosyltransferase [Microbacterium thalassium]MBB6392882.1 UDP:flavonoid glycosyltransferase YjiC (YdhE family) [Microbacterium thalassium]GLK22887.1 glycosyl transferase [Microbacterium thalassium]